MGEHAEALKILLAGSPSLAEDPTGVADCFGRLVEGALEAHPAWITNARFAERLSEILVETKAGQEVLGALRGADLYLATAVLDGNLAACASLEELIRRTSSAVIGRMGGDGAASDEVASEVIEKLLLSAAPDKGSKLASFKGRGSLVGWLRATLSRTYLNTKRKHKREVLVGDNAVLAALDADHSDPVMAHIKAQYRAEFAVAFEEAIGSLTDRQRGVLRYRFVDGASIESIASVYRVHRATCHRWISDARAALARATERSLKKRLNASGEEIESIRALVESQLELSLSRMFAG